MKTKNKLTKGIATVCLSFLFCSAINSQDVLTLKNGEQVNVKVIEITDSEIKYRKSDNLQGPLRIVTKAEVFSIKYENGAKDVFNEEPVKTINNNTGPVRQIIIQQPAPVFNKFDKDSSDFAKIKPKQFGGPRIGLTYLTPGTSADYLSSEGKDWTLVQFGWQFEGRLFTVGNTQGLIEFIPLIGGVEKGLFIPSANLLLGVRHSNNIDRAIEFAIGPNLAVTRNYQRDVVIQPGVVIGLGFTFIKGNVNFPVNLAFIPSVASIHDVYDYSTNTSSSKKFETGMRISLLVGFNYRKK